MICKNNNDPIYWIKENRFPNDYNLMQLQLNDKKPKQVSQDENLHSIFEMDGVLLTYKNGKIYKFQLNEKATDAK